MPGIVHLFDFILFISFDYHWWWRFLLLIQEGILSGILQARYRLDIVKV
jgi:hypothetical protein